MALECVPWEQAAQGWPTYERFLELCPAPLSVSTLRHDAPWMASRQMGLWWPCSRAQVRAAYRERARQCHPDRGGDAAEFRALQAEYEQLQSLDLAVLGNRKRAFVGALLATNDVQEAATTADIQPGWAWRWVAQHLDVWAVLTWEGIDPLALLENCPDTMRRRLKWCIGRIEE